MAKIAAAKKSKMHDRTPGDILMSVICYIVFTLCALVCV